MQLMDPAEVAQNAEEGQHWGGVGSRQSLGEPGAEGLPAADAPPRGRARYLGLVRRDRGFKTMSRQCEHWTNSRAYCSREVHRRLMTMSSSALFGSPGHGSRAQGFDF